MSDRPSSTAASSPLALRVALVEHGRIIAEKTITEGALSFDGSRLLEGAEPSALASFERDDAGFFLRTHLEGRLQLDGQQVHAVDGRTALALDDQGRLSHGGRDVLFQLVEAPRPRRAPGLPASMRSHAGVDARFTAIALASLLGHFAFVVVLEHMDPPYVAAAAPPARVVELLMDAPMPPPPAPPELPSLPSEDTTPTEVADAEPTRAPSNSATRGPRGPSASEPVDSARMVATLGAELDHALIGAVNTAGLAGSTPSFDSVTRTMGTSAGASGASTLAERSGGGRVTTEGLGGLALAAGGGDARDEGGELVERGPVGTVRPSGEIIYEPSGGVLDSQTVTRAIGRRLGAIRGCYERELRGDPSLQGSLDMTFTIEESGSVTRVHATDDTLHSARMTECVARIFRGLTRFTPGPEGGSVVFTYPLVFVPGA